MESPTLRIYLTGTVCLEAGATALGGSQFPSRQCRLLFAYLVCQRDHPVTREEIAEALWPGQLPSGWDSGLKSLVSRLRQFCGRLGLTPPVTISNQFGCYQLDLPSQTWVDLEAARHSIDEAEGNLRSGAAVLAWGNTNVALAIASRPLLPGEEAAWIAARRQQLHDIHIRALDTYVEVCLRTSQEALAAQMASQSLSLEPFRESSYQQLMRAYAASGNRAEALRVYHQCQKLLVDELGVDPSPETEALYQSLLAQ